MSIDTEGKQTCKPYLSLSPISALAENVFAANSLGFEDGFIRVYELLRNKHINEISEGNYLFRCNFYVPEGACTQLPIESL